MSKRSSKRQLSFGETTADTCSLCHKVHTWTSTPSQWTSEEASKLVISWGMPDSAVVCKPCRGDINKLLKDGTYIPRWKRNKGIQQCCISECSEAGQIMSNMLIHNLTETLTSLQLTTKSSQLSTPTPFCTRHYNIIYKFKLPLQRYCATCNISLRYTTFRPCTQPTTVQRLLKEKTEFTGHLTSKDLVCYACYKSHLQSLIQHSDSSVNTVSTDADLQQLILSLRSDNILCSK
jgi:hypothetical protein